LEEFLPLVLRPSRYIGHEINAIQKDPSIVKTWVALAFPDTYEVGMSHLGIQILYKVLNDIPHVAAERVYAPWMDYERLLRAKTLPLMSLESSRPLRRFDIIGFTLQYELGYSNVLNILNLSDIPLRSQDRDNGYPLIIAGGPCAFNPEPLADFIDAFLIGDGEEAIVEIVRVYEEWRAGGGQKEELLKGLTGVEGVYVPSLYKIDYLPDGRIKGINGPRVRKRFLFDLESAPFPDRPIVPYLKIVHDRITLEIARGCLRGCRFCQAGIIYRPWRERSHQRIISLAEESLKNTGYEEVSLASLSSGDHSSLLPLIRDLTSRFGSKRISVSLPSLRIGTLNDDIIREIRKIRKTGFTIAPEAGTERLRRVINKELDEEGLDRTVRWIFDEGWDTLKLYFMIGLPTEREDDLRGIIEMVRRILRTGKGKGHRPLNINLSISAFVPKAHTPFQWKGQIPLQEIRDRIDYLRGHLRDRRLNIKGHEPETSLLEAIFARGDRRLGPVISRAFMLGCRFDGWIECFDWDRWKKAFEEAGIEPESYAKRDMDIQDILPWDFIETGVKKEFLEREYRKAFLEEWSRDCRYGPCLGCGLPCEKEKWVQDPRFKVQGFGAIATPHISRPKFPVRIRLRFSKTGLMRFLSHLELMTAIQRAVARADLPIAFSSGFNPHPKISFGPALPVGVEGLNEYLDMELISPVNIKHVVDGLNRCLPEGLRIHEGRIISRRAVSLSSLLNRYIYSIEISKDEIELLKEMVAKESIPIKRRTAKGIKWIDLRTMIRDIKFLNATQALITLQDTEVSSVKPLEVLGVLLRRNPLSSNIRRIGVFGMVDGEWVDPLGSAEMETVV